MKESISQINQLEVAVPKIKEEIDEPSLSANLVSDLQKLSNRYVKSLEQLKIEHNIEIDKWAIGLLIGCIVALLLVYVFERLVSVYNETVESESARIVSEILKFLISSLIGFLFAKRTA